MIEWLFQTVAETPVAVLVLLTVLLYPIFLGACREIGSVYFLVKRFIIHTVKKDSNT